MAHQDRTHFIRESVRTTIHNALSSVIQEVTEEELRSALRDPTFKDLLMQVIRVELQRALTDLHGNGTGTGSKSKRWFHGYPRLTHHHS